MRKILFTLFILLLPAQSAYSAGQTMGMKGFLEAKECVMSNDLGICHAILTPDSYALFDRFYGYKLMPCLPTDFSYVGEGAQGGHILVTLNMPQSNNTHYVLHLLFDMTPQGLKLDLPETLHRGMGDNWENKIQLSEQLYLMMKQNMGDKLNCDQLTGLIKQ